MFDFKVSGVFWLVLSGWLEPWAVRGTEGMGRL